MTYCNAMVTLDTGYMNSNREWYAMNRIYAVNRLPLSPKNTSNDPTSKGITMNPMGAKMYCWS